MGRYLLAVVLMVAAAPTIGADCPRIVSQSPYITKSLQWLGLERCIVGASRYDEMEVAATGGVMDPDYAAIARLEPDLMVTSDWTDGEEWARNAPEGTRTLVLHGFDSMAEVVENLRRLGRAGGLPDAQKRAADFANEWKKQAKAVGGDRRRVLLLNACGKTAYSYGPGTWLADLFTAAGFDLAETREGVTGLDGGAPAEAIRKLVEATRPEILFTLKGKTADRCPLLAMDLPARVVPLPGEHFLHPAPVVLKGLADLQALRLRKTDR